MLRVHIIQILQILLVQRLGHENTFSGLYAHVNTSIIADEPASLLQDGDHLLSFGSVLGDSATPGLVIAPWNHLTSGGMRVDYSGNIGINKFDPSFNLDVSGTILTDQLKLTSYNINGFADSNDVHAFRDDGSGNILYYQSRTDRGHIWNTTNASLFDKAKMKLYGSGNLFIAEGEDVMDSISKNIQLYIDGSANSNQTVGAPYETVAFFANSSLSEGSYNLIAVGKNYQSTNNWGELRFDYAQDASTNNTVSLGFFSNGRLLNVKPTGYVGIGTYEPSTTLDVSGGTIITQDRSNLVIGTPVYQPLIANPPGKYNTVLGINALPKYSAGGSYNIAVGGAALTNNTDGSLNIAIGKDSLYTNTIGAYNIAIGESSMYSNTNASFNIGIGNYSLQNSSGFTAINNIAIGTASLASNINGGVNIGIGNQSLYDNTDGSHNIAIGNLALNKNTGSYNIGIGSDSLYSNIGGKYNIAIGRDSLASESISSSNIGIGYRSFNNKCMGNYNTAIGDAAGYTDISGYNNTYIGSNADVVNTPGIIYNNATVVGYNAKSSKSHSVILGDYSDFSLNVGIGTASPDFKLEVDSYNQVNNGLLYNSFFKNSSIDVVNNPYEQDASNNVRMLLGKNFSVNNAAEFRFNYFGSNDFSNALALGFINNSNLFNLNAWGNVGIGTQNPQAIRSKMHLYDACNNEFSTGCKLTIENGLGGINPFTSNSRRARLAFVDASSNNISEFSLVNNNFDFDFYDVSSVYFHAKNGNINFTTSWPNDFYTNMNANNLKMQLSQRGTLGIGLAPRDYINFDSIDTSGYIKLDISGGNAIIEGTPGAGGFQPIDYNNFY